MRRPVIHLAMRSAHSYPSAELSNSLILCNFALTRRRGVKNRGKTGAHWPRIASKPLILRNFELNWRVPYKSAKLESLTPIGLRLKSLISCDMANLAGSLHRRRRPCTHVFCEQGPLPRYSGRGPVTAPESLVLQLFTGCFRLFPDIPGYAAPYPFFLSGYIFPIPSSEIKFMAFAKPISGLETTPGEL